MWIAENVFRCCGIVGNPEPMCQLL